MKHITFYYIVRFIASIFHSGIQIPTVFWKKLSALKCQLLNAVKMQDFVMPIIMSMPQQDRYFFVFFRYFFFFSVKKEEKLLKFFYFF